MSKKNPHFLPTADINAIVEAGGAPWSLISKESGEVLGTVRTRTIAREIAPSLNAKVDKYVAPVEEKKVEKKPRPKLNNPKATLPVEDTPEADVGLGDKKEEEKKGETQDQPSLPGVERPQDMTKCPKCGSEEIFTGRIDEKTGIVKDEGLVGGCHRCDWEWNLIDVQRAKSVIQNPTRVAWDIADAMLLEPRKEVVKAMIAAGIANGTSRTQYQYWFNVNKARKLQAIADHKAKLAEKSKESK